MGVCCSYKNKHSETSNTIVLHKKVAIRRKNPRNHALFYYTFDVPIHGITKEATYLVIGPPGPLIYSQDEYYLHKLDCDELLFPNVPLIHIPTTVQNFGIHNFSLLKTSWEFDTSCVSRIIDRHYNLKARTIIQKDLLSNKSLHDEFYQPTQLCIQHSLPSKDHHFVLFDSPFDDLPPVPCWVHYKNEYLHFRCAKLTPQIESLKELPHIHIVRCTVPATCKIICNRSVTEWLSDMNVTTLDPYNDL